jgi:hypothetical protein
VVVGDGVADVMMFSVGIGTGDGVEGTCVEGDPQLASSDKTNTSVMEGTIPRYRDILHILSCANWIHDATIAIMQNCLLSVKYLLNSIVLFASIKEYLHVSKTD